MTNPEVKNPYLRALLARELLGYRRSHWTMQHFGLTDGREYVIRKYVFRNSFGRVDLHLHRHGAALVAGDVTPLNNYPASFAGHA